MKKIKIIFLFVFISQYLFAKKIPSDSTILKTIFGRVDKSKKTFSRSFTENEKQYYHSKKKIEFSITYKNYLRTDSNQFLIVIADANFTIQNNHSLGHRNVYKLIKQKGKWQIAAKIIMPENQVVLMNFDSVYFEKLGSSQHTLVIINQSDGNQHLETNYIFYELGFKSIKPILYLPKSYSNEAWSFIDSSGNCYATIRDCKYELIKSKTNEWHNIKATTIEIQGKCLIGDYQSELESLNKNVNKVLDIKVEYFEFIEGKYSLISTK